MRQMVKNSLDREGTYSTGTVHTRTHMCAFYVPWKTHRYAVSNASREVIRQNVKYEVTNNAVILLLSLWQLNTLNRSA